MNKSKTKIIMIVSTLVFVVTLGLVVSLHGIDKQTEDTTTLYTATVSGVAVVETEKTMHIEICTKEYNTFLLVSTNISPNINLEDIKELKNGQTISFRIENRKVGQMDKVNFINIVSLKTDTKSIFSLEDYNEFVYDFAYPVRLAGISIVVLSLVTLVFCLFKTGQIGVQAAGSVSF